MNRIEKLLLAVLLAMGAAFGAVAQEAAQPADPITPAPEMAEPAPEIPDVAWVRVAHFSPNSGEMTINLTPASDDAAFSGDSFGPVSYESFTEYVEIPAGNYVVRAEAAEDAGELEKEFSFARGNYYTLAALGMVLPPEAQANEDDDEEEGGFVGFFRNLFGNGDGDRDELALQFNLFEDDLTRQAEEGETLIRIVHAAPGTQDIDLAVIGEQGTIVDNIKFGNASRYAGFEGSLEDLELRLAGSRAATLGIEGLNLQAGNLNTIYVVGTPVERAPLTALGSSVAPVEAGMPAGEDVAAQTVGASETAGGGAGDGDADDAEDAETEGEESEGEETEGEESAGDAEADDAEGVEGEGEPEDDAEGDEAETEEQQN